MPSVKHGGDVGGRDVVLIHGFAGTGRAWDPVAERLDAEPTGRWRSTCAATAPRRAARPSRSPLRGRRARRGARSARAVRLLARRADRAARRARRARARGPARARRDDGGHRGRRASAPRAGRATSELAAYTDTATPEAFADRWAEQPLFAGTPPEAARLWRDGHAAQRPGRPRRGAARASAPASWSRCGTASAS